MTGWVRQSTGNCAKKNSIWPYEQVLYAQPGIHSEEWHAQTSPGF